MLEWADCGGQMGTFRVEATVRNLEDPGRTRTLSLPVDTGATYTTLPRDVVEALGCQPIGKRHVLLANGREEEWPVGAVSLTLEGQELPTVCLIGPNGGPALLGAVTLEEFALSVDPVAKRLVPLQSRVHAIDEMAHVLVLPALAALIHGVGDLSIGIGEPEGATGPEVAEGARVRLEGPLPHGELESEPEARRPLEDEVLPVHLLGNRHLDVPRIGRTLLPTCRQAATSTAASK